MEYIRLRRLIGLENLSRHTFKVYSALLKTKCIVAIKKTALN
jgi:hypothetical protein